MTPCNSPLQHPKMHRNMHYLIPHGVILGILKELGNFWSVLRELWGVVSGNFSKNSFGTDFFQCAQVTQNFIQYKNVGCCSFWKAFVTTMIRSVQRAPTERESDEVPFGSACFTLPRAEFEGTPGFPRSPQTHPSRDRISGCTRLPKVSAGFECAPRLPEV